MREVQCLHMLRWIVVQIRFLAMPRYSHVMRLASLDFYFNDLIPSFLIPTQNSEQISIILFSR